MTKLREIVAALIVAASAGGALATDAFGPPFGANRYTTSIADVDGAADVDDYVSSLLAGEAITITVAANKGSALRPTLSLVDPDGNAVTPPVIEKKGGIQVQLKSFAVPATGRWAVRVGGKDGTQGAYTVTFAVKGVKAKPVKNQVLGGAAPLFVDIPFQGVDGALVTLSAKGSKSQSQLHMGSVKGPDGQDVAGLSPVEKKGSVSVTNLRLDRGDGVYTLRLFIDAGEAKYTLSIKTTPQGRPKSKKPVALSVGEPSLEARATPIRGIAGLAVTLNGANLQGATAPKVFFGRAEASGVNVAIDGRSLTAVPPVGTHGDTVSVAVVAADGQGSVRDAYFHYVPPPTITDLRRTDGAQARGGSGEGGLPLRLLGTNFEDGFSVVFGTRAALNVVVVSATEITLVTPTGPTGPATVSVRDNFGRTVNASFLFQYKAPPQFSDPAYDPPYGPTAGNVTITLRGLGFESTDRVEFDGSVVPSTFVSTTRRTFVLPARSEGTYSLRLVDRFESVGDGPDFPVQGPPVVSSVQAVDGPRIGTDKIAIGGGAVVRIQGSNLGGDRAVTIGGADAVVSSGSDTQMDVVAPAGAAGPADVVVADAVGQSATATGALNYVGFADATASRSPGATGADDLTALRGATGDLDGDGRADDLVLASFKTSPGSRNELTRLFFGQAGVLTDVTATKFPSAGSDPEGVDDYHAAAVAIGDLDSTAGKDIVIAGEATYGTYVYYYYYYYYYYYREARVFANNGSGTFTFDTRSPMVRTDPVMCGDGAGGSFKFFVPGSPNGDVALAVALGDLDGDGDAEIVTAGSQVRNGTLYLDPAYVTLTPGDYVDTQASSHYSYYGYFTYAPAMRIFDSTSAGFVDVTFPRAPLVGSAGQLPSLVGRDLAIGDLDGDGSPEIVITWDDPLTVTPYGSYYGYGTAYVATRVLRNDGNGFFTDATDEVLPAGSAPEFWQGHAVGLADLDGDDDLDVVVVHEQSVDAYQGTPTFTSSALRILRNDGDSGLTDVTASALPTIPLEGSRDDNLRGGALALRDVDGDALPDILVSTTEALVDSGGLPWRRTRFLLNAGSLQFIDASAFLPAASVDTGEANDILIGDVSGAGTPTLILVGETVPQTSSGGESLRVHDWDE